MPYAGGIDIGSLTAKAVLLDGDARILGRAVVPTGAWSQEAGEKAFQEALARAGLCARDVGYTLATGYGRKNVPFAQGEMTEITCHARGAHHQQPDVRTIIDIGGQDSKAITVSESGAAVNFIMNDKCAAGCGRFLEVMARALEVELDRMGELSLQAKESVPISSMCTVFAESEVVSAVARKRERSDIISGIHNAIAKRVAIMVEQLGLRERVTMTGGVAKNVGVVRALEKHLGTVLFVPPEPQLVGALGAALIALQRAKEGAR